MVMVEALILTLIGALLGRLLGYGIAWAVGRYVSAQSSIPVSVRFLPELEPFLWLLPVTLGLLAGLVPAMLAYRVDVVEKLFPT
jgi:putative ABC transport system permease protein